MVSNFFHKYGLLICIFIVACVFRFYNITNIPTGIHGDEASIGYNAYSLLKTGYDQNGKFLPLSIDQFGDFRPPGYHYLDIPFVAVFGLNEFSTRLPAALFGSLTVIIFYFLLLEIFAKKNIGYIGSGLLAISPWHIVISRATSESVIAAFFVILGLYFMIIGYKRKDHILQRFVFSFIFLSISFLFYHSVRLFVPIFIIFLFIILAIQYGREKTKLRYSMGLCISLLCVVFFLIVFGKGGARPFDISIFNVSSGISDLEQQIGEDGTQNPYITRFFHNKLFYFGRTFLTYYFQHLNGDFFFVHNGLPARYKVPWSGNLHFIELPILLIGFSILIAEGIKLKKYHYFIPILWICVGAIPAGFTWEDVPNIQRASMMLYGLIAVSAFGISEIFSIVRGKIRIILLAIFFFVLFHNVLYFTHNYFYHSRIHESWNRSAAAKEVAFTIDELSKVYSTIRMTTQGNNNLIHYLFYTKFDPKVFKSMNSPREEENLKFGKISLTGKHCPLEGNPLCNAYVDEGTVYIDMPYCKLPRNAEIIKVIRHPDGLPAYNVVRLNSSVSPGSSTESALGGC